MFFYELSLANRMDTQFGRRDDAPHASGSNQPSCSLPKELVSDIRTSHSSKRVGVSRVSSVRPIQIQGKDVVRESSRISERPSSSRLVSKKSVPTVPSAGPSIPSTNSKKVCKTYHNHAVFDQPSSSENSTTSSTFYNSGYRSTASNGLKDLPNITSSKALAHQGTIASSQSRILGQSSRNTFGVEQEFPPGNLVSRQESLDCPGFFNADDRISNSLYGGQQDRWTETVNGDSRDVGHPISLRPFVMTDVGISSLGFDEDIASSSGDLFSNAISASEDYFDMDVSASSGLPLQANHFSHHRDHAQERMIRGSVSNADTSHLRPDEEMHTSRHFNKERGQRCSLFHRTIHGSQNSQGHANSRSVAKYSHIAQSSNISVRQPSNGLTHNLASDSISPSASSSRESALDQSGNRRAAQCRTIPVNHVPSRNAHSTKHPSASSSSTSSKRSNKNVADMDSLSNTTKMNVVPEMSRRTVRPMQPTLTSRVISEDVIGLERFHGSGSRAAPTLEQTGSNSKIGVATSSISLKGRNYLGTCRQDEHTHGRSSTSGQRLTNQPSGSSRRGTTSGLSGTRIHGSSGSLNHPNNSLTEPSSSSYHVFSGNGIANSTSSRSTTTASRALQLSAALDVNPSQANPLSAHTDSASSPGSALMTSTTSVSQPFSETSSLSSLLDGLENLRSRETGENSFGLPILLHSNASGHESFRSLSIDGNNHTRYTVDGLAEVLLALERIEQNEELTYEQVLMLEANLLSGAINFHDRHHDMRLDIDNMSYEELLALEERMGSVSTGLTDDTISKCLLRFSFASDVATNIPISEESEVKCCICQEEYQENEELGRLNCKHSYHTSCIRQWLLQKNQCPICKATAA
eukprot:TRINITY_DN3601_c0_g1_i2.p1 TRINITY_DN3601_c0_g1~~TRINITY_DN3601_c0_g1_i2.p1  ORF type:complete len:864 (-),score=166.89 TRINITY_DN3601_c0_g1_i2:167-2758(-)